MPKTIKRFLYPHPVLILILVIISAGLLIFTFSLSKTESIFGYVSYFVSAYTLTVVCVRAPKIYKAAVNFKRNNKYLKFYSENPKFRIRLSLLTTLVINVLYAFLQLFSGFYYHSAWFYALSGYYVVLAVMRYLLLKDANSDGFGKDYVKELKRYRFCGILLLEMNITLLFIVFYIVRQNRGFEYHYIYTIALAAFTFTITTLAIVNLVRYKKYKSPVMSASKIISLVSAAVSMLSLETAMLSAFGSENTPQFRRIMTALTGTAVCVLVLFMAIFMIVYSSVHIKKGK